MSDINKVLVRNAREQDILAVAELNAEACAPNGTTAETSQTFQLRLTAFQNGFIILVAENEIAAYGCSEKWLAEREPGLAENPAPTHNLEGKIFCITGMAVKTKYQKRGYGLLILDKLIEIAHLEGCKKIVLETSHAQGFYQKRGFKKVGTRTEREVALDSMALELQPIRGIQ
ncbi:MAG: N-acetyltransferase [Chloroflexota bacterium]